ncbi:MAG: tetratricopeptide repeat protein [Pyrinomonadaceae bacterium]
MSKISIPSGRAALLALCAFVFCVASASGAQARRRHNARRGVQQSGGQQQPSVQPKKPKKLPPGARGFEQFANRDASDKLITGGATRGEAKNAAEAEAMASLDRGMEAYKAEKYDDAVQAFSRAAELEPTWFRAQYRLGMAYEAQVKYREAAAAYGKAVGLTPDEVIDEPMDFFKAQYNLANSLALSSQHEAAVATYQKLIESLPAAIPTPYYNLGLSYAALGKSQEATDALKKAIEIKPDYAEAHYNLGLIYAHDEQYPQAIDEFRQAIKTKPGYAEARYNLALAYYLTDDRAGLAEQQKALQAMNPKLAADLAKLK